MSVFVGVHVPIKRPTDFDNEVGTSNNHRQKRPKKNNPKEPPKTAPSCTPRRQTRSVTAAQRRQKPPSALESLPADIIEQILLYSLNANLPRASPYLAAAVSNERVYRLLILLAFWDNDECYDDIYNDDEPEKKNGLRDAPKRFQDLGPYPYPSRRNRMYSIPWILRPLGYDYVPLTPDERGELQSIILQCRWCTEERIRRQFPDLARLIIARLCLNAGYEFEREEGLDLEDLIQSEDREPFGFFATREPENRRKKRKRDKHPDCEITVHMGRSIDMSLGKYGREAQVSLYFSLVGVKEIPPSLLRADISHNGRLVRGRFTDAHVAFFNTLYLSGMRAGSYSQDAMKKGIDIALLTVNPRALSILLKIRCFMIDARNHQLRYPIIPSDHFRTAAQVYMNNKGKPFEDYALLCFCLLLTIDAESLPHDDPVIKEFATVAGGAFGKWLLDLITFYLPSHKWRMKHFGQTELFSFGFPATEKKMGSRYYDEVMRGDGRELFRLTMIWSPYNDFEDLIFGP